MKNDDRYKEDKIHENEKNLKETKTRVITYQLPLGESSVVQKEAAIHSRKDIQLFDSNGVSTVRNPGGFNSPSV